MVTIILTVVTIQLILRILLVIMIPTIIAMLLTMGPFPESGSLHEVFHDSQTLASQTMRPAIQLLSLVVMVMVVVLVMKMVRL